MPLSPEEWAAELEERKDYRALAAVFNSMDRSPEFAGRRKEELARKILATAGSEAVPGILEELETEGVGRLGLALILQEIGDPRAVPLLKTQLDRGAFDAYGSKRHIVRFVERHPHLHGPEEMVQCALCGKTRPAAETSGYHHEGKVKRFCVDTCWSRRGKMVGSKLGAGCPYYSDGMCAAGAGDSPCSLQVGDYTSCHVYALG